MEISSTNLDSSKAPMYNTKSQDSHKSPLIKKIGGYVSHRSMCDQPHVVYVPQPRGLDIGERSMGSVQPLLLGLYGLLALFALARLLIPSLSTSATAFQVLQGDTVAATAGAARRKRQAPVLYTGS